MEKIYVVMSHTGTALSKVIRLKTGAEYTHVSIALDKSLKQMYSFGRLHSYNAFIGGFVRESKNFGTFKRFKETQVSILELPVTDEQYKKISDEILYFKKNKKRFKFNILGLFLAGINRKNEKEDYFYCAEFVKYILKNASVDIEDLPEIIKPEDFGKMKNVICIYKGYLRDYTIEEIKLIEFLRKIAPNIALPV